MSSRSPHLGDSAPEVRRATVDDAEAVASVLRQAFAEHRPLYTPRAFEATVLSRAEVVARLDDGPIWLALQDRLAVGTAAAVPSSAGCYLRGMGVIPAARGHDVGGQLLQAVERFALGEGLSRLYLSTTPFLDRAISLYERFGFVRTEGGPPDLYGTPLFTMEARLRGDGEVS